MKNICPIVYCSIDFHWKEHIRELAKTHGIIGLLNFSYSHHIDELLALGRECGLSVSFRNQFTVTVLTRNDPWSTFAACLAVGP